MFVTDREGVIEYVNPAFERLNDWPREEALGKTPRLPADVSVECLLESGHIAATISRVARQRDCDAITLGAVRRTASKRMACGLVAEAVLRSAGCAVIAVGVPAGAGRMRIDR